MWCDGVSSVADEGDQRRAPGEVDGLAPGSVYLLGQLAGTNSPNLLGRPGSHARRDSLSANLLDTGLAISLGTG